MVCNSITKNLVGSVMVIFSPIPLCINLYTLFSKVTPSLKSPHDILLKLAAESNKTRNDDFGEMMGFMGDVQKEMNYLFDFIDFRLICQDRKEVASSRSKCPVMLTDQLI